MTGVVGASQQSIAAELGTAREVVFRALRSLAQQGLVQTGRFARAAAGRVGAATHRTQATVASALVNAADAGK